MSNAQATASRQFVNAMGPLIEDERSLSQVMAYIALLRHQAEPCQYSTSEMHDILVNSIASVHDSGGTPHAELKKEIQQRL